MKFYCINPKADQHRRKDGSILIANELYTEKEFAKFEINPIHATLIEVPKNKTYWFFGARFKEEI